MPTLEQLLADNIAINTQLLNYLKPIGIDKAFYPYEVDLTSAHTNLEVPVGDFRWVQFWCDGTPIGITVGIGTQDNKISLEKFSAVPVIASTKVYVTNDVRAGRSKLLLIFSRTAPLESYLGGQISIAELAARLGSIHTFDRRGDILWYDDFESGNLNRWVVSTTGTGPSVSLSTAHARSGSLCCKFITGAALGNLTQISRNISYPFLSKLGAEVHVTIPSGTLYFTLTMTLYDGTSWYLASIRLDSNTGNLAYRDLSGTFQDFVTGLLLNVGDDTLHGLKFVVDFQNKKYARCIFGAHEYDLSRYVLYTSASVTNPVMSIIVALNTMENAIKTSFLDDAVVTQNEP